MKVKLTLRKDDVEDLRNKIRELKKVKTKEVEGIFAFATYRDEAVREAVEQGFRAFRVTARGRVSEVRYNKL